MFLKQFDPTSYSIRNLDTQSQNRLSKMFSKCLIVPSSSYLYSNTNRPVLLVRCFSLIKQTQIYSYLLLNQTHIAGNTKLFEIGDYDRQVRIQLCQRSYQVNIVCTSRRYPSPPPPLCNSKYQLALYFPLNVLALIPSPHPTPLEFPIPLVEVGGEYGYFLNLPHQRNHLLDINCYYQQTCFTG